MRAEEQEACVMKVKVISKEIAISVTRRSAQGECQTLALKIIHRVEL